MTGVVLADIKKSFGSTPVLKGVSLDIAAGEFLTLVGPSGCGKSTLLRILAGLELQDSGTVSIGGRVVDGLRPKARDVAMVFQSYALYPHMTVERNMAVPLVMRHLSAMQRLPLIGRVWPGTAAKRAEIARDVHAVATALEIEPLLHRKPGQLSGGQRQRVAVGRAMVRQPAVFLMDEPLSNLDAKLRVQMRAEIKELHAKLGITFVYVTHDQTEAMTMSDRVGVMLDGELVQVAPPYALYDNPDDVRVAGFIGSPRINLLKATVAADGTIAAIGANIAVAHRLPPGTAVTLGIRPEALTLAREPIEQAITGRVRLVEHVGADLYIHADVAGETEPVIARVTPRDGRALKPGAPLRLVVHADTALLFDASGRRLRAVPNIVGPLRERANT
jgi:multiple sugar transport system ATP-binding protein